MNRENKLKVVYGKSFQTKEEVYKIQRVLFFFGREEK